MNTVKYLNNHFIDFKGLKHEIIMCAVSASPGEHLPHQVEQVINFSKESGVPITRVVTLGISICNPEDTFNLERGKRAAYNKAVNNPSCPTLFANMKGIINDKVVDAFMEQEMQYIIDNPERIIKGYNEAKKRWMKAEERHKLEKLQIQQELQNLTELEKSIVNAIRQNKIDLNKCEKLAKYDV